MALSLPGIKGTRGPQPGDAVRLAQWFKIGIRHSLEKATSRRARIYLRLLLVLYWPFWPLIIVQKWVELRRPGRRYYFALDDTAVLALQGRGEDWVLEDHSAQNPGTGQGLALRDILRPELMATLDAEGRGLRITAADARLAAVYIAEMPGLMDLGPAWPRGRRLYRPPGTGSGS